MQGIWKKMSVFICLMLFGYTFSISGAFAQGPDQTAKENAAENPETEIQSQPRHLVVTYFHTTFRCYTCRKIEEFSKDAVQFNFEKELKSGKLIWQAINVDEPENKHYIKEYQLYTKSLIVSEIRDGKRVRWKNLPKIWTLIRDKAKYDEYVKTEIKKWLRE